MGLSVADANVCQDDSRRQAYSEATSVCVCTRARARAYVFTHTHTTYVPSQHIIIHYQTNDTYGRRGWEAGVLERPPRHVVHRLEGGRQQPVLRPRTYSYIKLMPIAGISFMCYEACKRILVEGEKDEG
jgi:hypothetical protein